WGPGRGARIREAYPSLALEVRNQRDMESFDQLLAGELDLAVRSREALLQGLRFEPLFASDRMLIVPRGHELAGKKRPTLRDLARHAFVIPPAGSTSRRLIEAAFLRAGLRLEIAMEAGRRPPARPGGGGGGGWGGGGGGGGWGKGGTLGGTDQGSGYLRFQLRQVPHDGRPDFLEVDAEVVVYENVPHRGYLGPGNVRMRASDLIRQASDRFANDLEVMKDPGLNQFVAIECRSATARILLDAFDRLQDVFEALPVPPQSGMASFRPRSRIRERSPRAMAMSTLRPRRASR